MLMLLVFFFLFFFSFFFQKKFDGCLLSAHMIMFLSCPPLYTYTYAHPTILLSSPNHTNHNHPCCMHQILSMLRRVHPEAAEFFSSTTLPFQCLEQGVAVRALGKVFTLHEDGSLKQFRYNNSDRAPLSTLSAVEVEQFYEYLPHLMSVMCDDELALTYKIEPGTTVVVDNYRVLHGRRSFQGTRSFVGCYTDRDHFFSQCRLHGLELAPPMQHQ
eukprot:m.289722 g.289722  ORF g.289722 m.289722 type:complete len:215 (-) comp15810_c0_seq8:1811-2455(-)